ncbi:class I SAM-dependent methyltransferase [Candidatus Peribacteria bacterium]|nr:MAG: class I SAM-dependent methyltransferase [Candidatus Peribacteria bacterium]
MSAVLHHDACPLCDGSMLIPAFECRDDLVSHETFTIVRCSECGFLVTQDAPAEEEIGRYYTSSDYMPHDIKHAGFMRAINTIRRLLRLPKKRRLIQRVTGRKTGRLLDIGCGNGEFALMMKNAGWEVSATESNDAMRQHCTALGIDCRSITAIHDIPSATFDVITLWHVLEHVHDLHGTMAHIRRLIAEDGRIIIAVPNIGGPLMRFYGIHDVPRHLWHFRPETLTHLAEKHGFEVGSIRPLFLDALYMGLYYERLLQGIALRGILIGIIDVLYGLIRPRHAASLVYVLRPVASTE